MPRKAPKASRFASLAVVVVVVVVVVVGVVPGVCVCMDAGRWVGGCQGCGPTIVKKNNGRPSYHTDNTKTNAHDKITHNPPSAPSAHAHGRLSNAPSSRPTVMCRPHQARAARAMGALRAWLCCAVLCFCG